MMAPEEVAVDATAWDDRYAGSELVWGAEPNRFVAAELGDLPPTTALDVACGEGRNAIWLASRGWRVTGVDFSAVAVERARRLAADAGVGNLASFEVGDVVAGQLPAGPFGLVVVAYLQLPAEERRRVLRSLVPRLSPGGTLFVVGHHIANLDEGVGGPQDPTVLYSAEDLVADLAGLDVRLDEAKRVYRPVDSAGTVREAVDVLLRARRGS